MPTARENRKSHFDETPHLGTCGYLVRISACRDAAFWWAEKRLAAQYFGVYMLSRSAVAPESQKIPHSRSSGRRTDLQTAGDTN